MRESLTVSPAPGFDPEVGAALWRLDDCRERTARVLQGVTDDELDAGSDGNSIGTILYHLALIEADWLFSEILETPIPTDVRAWFPADDRDEQGILSVVRGRPLEQHLSLLADVRARLALELRDMIGPEFARARTLPRYDVTPAWVLHHLAQHEAEHRGEIGSILARVRRAAGSATLPT